MPLIKGKGSIRANVTELMKRPESASRIKAIHTLAKKHNIPFKEAQFRQARAIAISQSRKK